MFALLQSYEQDYNKSISTVKNLIQNYYSAPNANEK